MIAELVQSTKDTAYFGTAAVVGDPGKDGRLPVSLEASSERGSAWIPVSLGCRPRRGDRVLVAGEAQYDLHVLAVLQSTAPRGFRQDRLESREGAWTELQETATGTSIRVFSKRGELLFDYEAQEDKATVRLQSDHVAFHTPGNLTFSSGRNIEFAAQKVCADARSEIRMSVTRAPGDETSSLTMQSTGIGLHGPNLTMGADRGRVAIDDMTYTGKRLVGVLETSKLVVGRLETIGRTVVSRVRNVYQKVSGLTQLRTGRMRTLVDSSYHLKAERANLKTEEEFKVDGKEILLG